MPLSFSTVYLGMVKSRLKRVPSGKDVSVVTNVLEPDMSLVTRSETSFRPAVMDSSLTGSQKINLSC